MGRMIDADLLREEVYSWGMNDYEPSDFTDAIDDAPTVEAIPKADYENRLKAEKIAMLEELNKEFDEQYYINRHELHDDFLNRGLEQGQNIIQQKINALRGSEYAR